MIYRISEPDKYPHEWVNRIINNDALSALKQIPDNTVALAVTSPPYWDVVDYDVDQQLGHTDYEQYIADMLEIWQETFRVLIPNGKLAIITPIMPIPKRVISTQHTRHLKNISNDIEFSILNHIPGLERYSLFVWQKQTSVKMFGSYPYPPNLYEDNTIEFINVFVKEGAPIGIPGEAKTRSKLTQKEWLNLTAQIWPLYPEDVKRARHPAPFPVALPQRLIKMYTFAEYPDMGFGGDIVLDMFNGTGSTCLAAKATHRNWIGIELNPTYCEVAETRLKYEAVDPDCIMLERVTVSAAKSVHEKKQLSLFPESELSE